MTDIVGLKQALEQQQEQRKRGTKRKADEMEDEAGSAPAKQSKWYLATLKFHGLQII